MNHVRHAPSASRALLFPRYQGQPDDATIAATCLFNSDSIGLIGEDSFFGDRNINMTTTITDLIEHIDELDAEDVIFAKPDWTEHAEARIFRLTEDFRPPPEATALGFKYFLEVDIVRQLMEDFLDKPSTPLPVKVARVIHYAIYDA